MATLEDQGDVLPFEPEPPLWVCWISLAGKWIWFDLVI
jgi:hypothetical protein